MSDRPVTAAAPQGASGSYRKPKSVARFPRLPLRGNIDLTYRCNNRCRHCWLWIPPDAPEARGEIGAAAILAIADEARALGCREWAISGGEPLLRPDFPEIFEGLGRRAASVSLLTNGTLITPAIARLLGRSRGRGHVFVALYGATPAVYEAVARRPGAFEAFLAGAGHLREAGVPFSLQIVPMKANFAELPAMEELARSLTPYWRIGAPWLWLSAGGDPGHDAEIRAQRLPAAETVRLDPSDPSWPAEEAAEGDAPRGCAGARGDDRLYAACLAGRRDFHIDPYGRMSFCAYVKDPALRHELRPGGFAEAWERAVPALAEAVRGGGEYTMGCGACARRADCRWCPVFGFLEHRRHEAKVEYLCQAAEAAEKSQAARRRDHRRFYRIGGLTFQVDSDLPFRDGTMQPKFKLFETDGPGEDLLYIRHHFSLPPMDLERLGRQVYRKPPWAIYEKDGGWIYLGIARHPGDPTLHRVALADRGHRRVRIFSPSPDLWAGGGLDSLTLFASDQILLARVLADREGAFLHAAGLAVGGKGYAFVGPSESGKSSIVKMFRDTAEILCDDRVIVRRRPGGFRIYGTWSHGEIPRVSAGEAPLAGLLFLHQAKANRLRPIADPRQAFAKLLARFVRPLLTADWWEKQTALAWKLASEVPCYDLDFDLSGEVPRLVRELAGGRP